MKLFDRLLGKRTPKETPVDAVRKIIDRFTTATHAGVDAEDIGRYPHKQRKVMAFHFVGSWEKTFRPEKTYLRRLRRRASLTINSFSISCWKRRNHRWLVFHADCRQAMLFGKITS